MTSVLENKMSEGNQHILKALFIKSSELFPNGTEISMMTKEKQPWRLRDQNTMCTIDMSTNQICGVKKKQRESKLNKYKNI